MMMDKGSKTIRRRWFRRPGPGLSGTAWVVVVTVLRSWVRERMRVCYHPTPYVTHKGKIIITYVCLPSFLSGTATSFVPAIHHPQSTGPAQPQHDGVNLLRRLGR